MTAGEQKGLSLNTLGQAQLLIGELPVLLVLFCVESRWSDSDNQISVLTGSLHRHMAC